MAECFEVVVILRLRTSGRFNKDPNLHEKFVGFLFFLMQCGADERLGNFATDGTVYPFFLRPFFVCSCLKGPTKFVCDASAFPFSVFEVLLSEEPLQVQVALGRVPLALLRLS